MKRIGFYGLGKVAQALARLFSEQGHYSVLGASQRSDATWPHPIGSLSELSECDYIFVLCNDGDITNYLDRLGDCPATLIYCSGAHEIKAEQLKIKTRRLVRAHPVYSFGEASRLASDFPGTPVVISGDHQASAEVSALFSDIGAKPIQSPELDSASYHTGLVIASNYLVTLSAMAKTLLSDAGIDKVDSSYMVAHLMHNTLANIAASDEAKALTGPIARGDIATIRKHLEVLASAPQSVRECYRTLGIQTLQLTQHDQELKVQIERLLNG